MITVAHKEPLTKEFADQAREYAENANRLESQIIGRINYIMGSIFNLFNEDQAYWYFYGGNGREQEDGSLWDHYSDDLIEVSVDCEGYDVCCILQDGSEFDLRNGIPTRWLFEDFEEELKNGKTQYIAKEKKRLEDAKQARVQKKEANLKLADIAKQKLTKKELKALRASLK